MKMPRTGIATGMFSESERCITYFHQARRYLKERDPLSYYSATSREIERLADCLMYEDFRRHIEPYMLQKQRLLMDFYNLQMRPDVPIPDWLQEALDAWDSMIAIEARKFGYAVR